MGYFAKGIIQKGRYRKNGCFQIILFSLENDMLTSTYFACRFLHSLPHHFTLQKAYVCTCFSFWWQDHTMQCFDSKMTHIIYNKGAK